MAMETSREDVEALIRDKYAGDRSVDLSRDLARLSEGEPLAYVIGWVPFLGLKINLNSHPLIPRPETEWWTEQLIEQLKDRTLRVLDLCAGSGAIGLSILAKIPGAHVSFGELMEEHVEQIRKNLELNGLDASRADIQAGDLFEPFAGETFDLIVTNPPYIPEGRDLPESVLEYEPEEALYSGADGLELVRSIAKEAPVHLTPGGELWIEADVENIEEAATLVKNPEIRTDPYGRPRLLVGHY